jgi:hypothetical protein
LEEVQDLVCHLSPNGMVAVGRDPITLILRDRRLTHVVKKCGPEKIRIAVWGTGLYRQTSMLRHVAFGVIPGWLGCTGKRSELRDRLDNPVPPPRTAPPQLLLD